MTTLCEFCAVAHHLAQLSWRAGGCVLIRGSRFELSAAAADEPSKSSIDSSHSICELKTRPKLREAEVATSSSGNCRPVSRSIDVTGLSVMPHGTISEKESRSVETFSAKPCVVTAARDVYADGGDLRLRLVRQCVGPDAGQSLDALGRDAIVATDADEHFFQAAHKLHRADVRIEAAQVEDGVGDELAGAVKGHVAAAIDLMQLDSLLGEKLGRGENVLQPRIAAQGDDRRMLQQK